MQVLFRSTVVLCSALLASTSFAQSSTAKKILALDKQWSDAAYGHDLAKTMSFYAKDAVILPPNSPICKTTKDKTACWAPMCDKSAEVTCSATKDEVAKSGDMAYTYGTYKLVMPDGKGGMMNDKGKFVEIWKKQANGAWKCAVDTFNSDLPAN